VVDRVPTDQVINPIGYRNRWRDVAPQG